MPKAEIVFLHLLSGFKATLQYFAFPRNFSQYYADEGREGLDGNSQYHHHSITTPCCIAESNLSNEDKYIILMMMRGLMPSMTDKLSMFCYHLVVVNKIVFTDKNWTHTFEPLWQAPGLTVLCCVDPS